MWRLHRVGAVSPNLTPQDDLLPAADRVKYHIDKKGQNYIDKEALTKWMEEAAVASQIGQDYIPFNKETKGMVSIESLSCELWYLKP